MRKEGWGWVEARIELDSPGLRQFTPCEHTVRKPSAEERSELTALSAREAELERESQVLSGEKAWHGPDAERISLEGEDIEMRRRSIREGLKVWPAEIQSRAGVIITVNREGDPAIIRGLLREADRKALGASQRKARKGAGKPLDPDEPTEDQAPSPQRVAPDISEALTRRLAAHRTAALQAVLAGNNPLALATLTHTLLRRAFIDDYGADRSAMQITATAASHALESVADDLRSGRAFQVVEAAKAKWRERLPDQRGEWFGWLIGLPQPELLELLGLCATLTLNALPAAGAAFDANAIANAADLNMADWWEPTAEGFLNHVSKAQIVQALKDAGPDLARDGVEGMKKDVLVNTAVSRLAGTRWLPVPLRASPA